LTEIALDVKKFMKSNVSLKYYYTHI